MATQYRPQTNVTATQADHEDIIRLGTADASYVLEGMIVSDAGGLDVNISTGKAMINGRLVEITSTETITITDNSTRSVQIDRDGTITERSEVASTSKITLANVVTSGADISSISHETETASNGFVYLVKTSDQTINSSTTLTTISELGNASFIGDGERWYARAHLIVNSGTTPDIKVSLAPDSTSDGYFFVIGPSGTVGTRTDIGTAQAVTTSGSDELIIVEGYVFSQGSGFWNIQFAQNTSDAGNTTVKSGSVFMAQRMFG